MKERGEEGFFAGSSSLLWGSRRRHVADRGFAGWRGVARRWFGHSVLCPYHIVRSRRPGSLLRTEETTGGVMVIGCGS